jgi:hypothetical protein
LFHALPLIPHKCGTYGVSGDTHWIIITPDNNSNHTYQDYRYHLAEGTRGSSALGCLEHRYYHYHHHYFYQRYDHRVQYKREQKYKTNLSLFNSLTLCFFPSLLLLLLAFFAVAAARPVEVDRFLSESGRTELTI